MQRSLTMPRLPTIIHYANANAIANSAHATAMGFKAVMALLADADQG
jgi:hypothetical protein